MPRVTSQSEAIRERDKAVKQRDEAIARITRAVTSLKFWNKRVDYYTGEAEITDHDRAIRRLRRTEEREDRRRRRVVERRLLT